MVLAAVEDLSDEEKCNDRCQPKPMEEKVRHRRLPRFKRKRVVTYENTVDLTRLRHLISSKCGCGCNCFHPFHGSIQLFDEWAKLRRLMAKMTKLEKDQHVTCSADIIVFCVLCFFLSSEVSTMTHFPKNMTFFLCLCFPSFSPAPWGLQGDDVQFHRRCLPGIQVFEDLWPTGVPQRVHEDDGDWKTQIFCYWPSCAKGGYLLPFRFEVHPQDSKKTQSKIHQSLWLLDGDVHKCGRSDSRWIKFQQASSTGEVQDWQSQYGPYKNQAFAVGFNQWVS